MSIPTFRFGQNWQRFVAQHLNDERIEEARKSLAAFLGTESLAGKTFVDVGCGSGLFSLAAHRMGAARVRSFDVDEDSVQCCTFLREREGDPESWDVTSGSVLDPAFLQTLGTFDVVYSWGVLHHTGDMYAALKNVSELVAGGGALYIAIYNQADGFALYTDGRFGPSGFWLAEKKFYASMPAVVQRSIDYTIMGMLILMYVLTLNNPLEKIRGHNSRRGMSWSVDITDWLGGYPYEYASVADIFAFYSGLGFTLRNLICNNGLLNNEFLFVKNAAAGAAD